MLQRFQSPQPKQGTEQAARPARRRTLPGFDTWARGLLFVDFR
jgi:hypothetical protein